MLAVIVGSAFEHWPDLKVRRRHCVKTFWGEPSGVIEQAELEGVELLLLRRHGDDKRILPHEINYRANIAALAELGARRVVSLNVVGGISEKMPPGALVLPDQLIDYTWGRAHSYCDAGVGMRGHIDFTDPYCEALRADVSRAGADVAVEFVDGGIYAVTQGPRLETRAEISRLARDGADLVGMTGMPEAALAREAGLSYTALCSVVNWAAGLGDSPITLASIEQVMKIQASAIQRCLRCLLTS